MLPHHCFQIMRQEMSESSVCRFELQCSHEIPTISHPDQADAAEALPTSGRSPSAHRLQCTPATAWELPHGFADRGSGHGHRAWLRWAVWSVWVKDDTRNKITALCDSAPPVQRRPTWHYIVQRSGLPPPYTECLCNEPSRTGQYCVLWCWHTCCHPMAGLPDTTPTLVIGMTSAGSVGQYPLAASLFTQQEIVRPLSWHQYWLHPGQLRTYITQLGNNQVRDSVHNSISPICSGAHIAQYNYFPNLFRCSYCSVQVLPPSVQVLILLSTTTSITPICSRAHIAQYNHFPHPFERSACSAQLFPHLLEVLMLSTNIFPICSSAQAAQMMRVVAFGLEVKVAALLQLATGAIPLGSNPTQVTWNNSASSPPGQ